MLFVTHSSSNWKLKLLVKTYHDVLHVANFMHLSKRDLALILIKEAPHDRELFLRHLLALWVRQNTPLTTTKLKLVRRFVKLFNITLTERDKHDLDLIEERLFATERHFKALPITLNINPDEVINIKFERGALYLKGATLKQLVKGVIYVSTTALTVANEVNFERLLWADVEHYMLTSYGFEMWTATRKLVLRAHDTPTLNATLYNFLIRKVPHALRKRQDY